MSGISPIGSPRHIEDSRSSPGIINRLVIRITGLVRGLFQALYTLGSYILQPFFSRQGTRINNQSSASTTPNESPDSSRQGSDLIDNKKDDKPLLVAFQQEDNQVDLEEELQADSDDPKVPYSPSLEMSSIYSAAPQAKPNLLTPDTEQKEEIKSLLTETVLTLEKGSFPEKIHGIMTTIKTHAKNFLELDKESIENCGYSSWDVSELKSSCNTFLTTCDQKFNKLFANHADYSMSNYSTFHTELTSRLRDLSDINAKLTSQSNLNEKVVKFHDELQKLFQESYSEEGTLVTKLSDLHAMSSEATAYENYQPPEEPLSEDANELGKQLDDVVSSADHEFVNSNQAQALIQQIRAVIDDMNYIFNNPNDYNQVNAFNENIADSISGYLKGQAAAAIVTLKMDLNKKSQAKPFESTSYLIKGNHGLCQLLAFVIPENKRALPRWKALHIDGQWLNNFK